VITTRIYENQNKESWKVCPCENGKFMDISKVSSVFPAKQSLQLLVKGLRGFKTELKTLLS
jgi:hypothetical protein